MTPTQTKWTERVRAWKASGRTAAEFAEGQGFKPSTLTYWASQLRRSPAEAGRPYASKRVPRVRMVRVVAPPASAAGEDTLVVVVGTARVVVRAGFDHALLRDVVEALGGAR